MTFGTKRARYVKTKAITALSPAGFEARHIMTVSAYRNGYSIRRYVFDTTATQKRSMSEALSDVTAEHESINDGFNEGIEDALALSLSQTEHIMKTIFSFVTYTSSKSLNQEVTINNKNNLND